MMDKWVLVTGASSGIGFNTCVHLDSVGYKILAVARSEERLGKLSKLLRNEHVIYQYDLANLGDIENIFFKCKEMGFKLDGMVHCAGISRDQPVRTNNLGDMVETFNVNLLSFVQLASFFCKKKYSKENSSIVGMSSVANICCSKGMCTYSASKAGIDVAVKVMSKEFAVRKIRVNSIQPGYVNTHMIDQVMENANAQPLGIIEPMDIAFLIEFLLSDKAKFISGSNIKISAALV